MMESGRSLAPSSRTEDGARSVLQDGGRSSRTESGPEPDSQIPGRSPLRPQAPSSRTEDGARLNSVLRSSGRGTELVMIPSYGRF